VEPVAPKAGDPGDGLPETPDRHGAFPRLAEDQILQLERHGERRATQAGDVLFREGDRSYDFFVVLGGKVAIVTGEGEEERIFAVHGPGRFLGELGLLSGESAFFTAVVREPGEVLLVPVARLRELVGADPVLGDLILRAYIIRRELLVGFGAGFRIIGSRFSPDTRRLREFAARNRLPHRWIDLEADPQAEALLRQLGVPPEDTPVVIWRGDQVLRNPGTAELAEFLGLRHPAPEGGYCDLIVVGAGPAGLAASLYGASEGLDTVAIDGVATGGQAATSSRIENYLGFPSGISGGELAERATLQAEKFGAHLTVPAEAVRFSERNGGYVVELDDGTEVEGRTVVIATGVRYRRLPVPRLEEFEGTSVMYAATLMEALLCRNDPIVVVGGGNSAGQATLFLSRHANHVTLLVREPELGTEMSRYLVDQIERSPAVDVRTSTEVRELVGDGGVLEAVVIENNRTGERGTIPARMMFVFIGAAPHTSWLGDSVAMDQKGFIVTGAAARPADGAGEAGGRTPHVLETSLPGVFAVGDVRAGSIKRVASAVGEGSMSVRLVHEVLGEGTPAGAAAAPIEEPAQTQVPST
jgi:thioredoxin reductase (NADPH)